MAKSRIWNLEIGINDSMNSIFMAKSLNYSIFLDESTVKIDVELNQ